VPMCPVGCQQYPQETLHAQGQCDPEKKESERIGINTCQPMKSMYLDGSSSVDALPAEP
jgi:hypothetical protein